MEIAKQYLETLEGACIYKKNAERNYNKAIVKSIKNINDNYYINLIKNNFIAFINYCTAVKESMNIIMKEYYGSTDSSISILQINKYFKNIKEKELNDYLLDYIKEDTDIQEMIILDIQLQNKICISLISSELYVEDEYWYIEHSIVNKYKFLADKLYNIYLKNKIEIDNYVYKEYSLEYF